MWYRMLRETIYKAEDKKAGMTAAEIIDALAHADPESRPRFTLSIGGKVQTIKIEEAGNEWTAEPCD